MNDNTVEERLSQYFKNQNSFTIADIYSFFSKTQPNIKRATVNWRIYRLVQQGLFQRIGRGLYTFGRERQFFPSLSKNYQIVSSILKKQFPLISYSVWYTNSLMELSHHIPAVDFFLVEVERDAIDSVFHILKETNKNTFKKPSKDMMEDFILDFKNAVIVKPLISESPLQTINGISVPRLEKILVDLYADKELFFYLEGNELLNIFNNAFDKYTINIDSLSRYANRRNKKQIISTILKQISSKKIGE
jgi:hypothetical protein